MLDDVGRCWIIKGALGMKTIGNENVCASGAHTVIAKMNGIAKKFQIFNTELENLCTIRFTPKHSAIFSIMSI